MDHTVEPEPEPGPEIEPDPEPGADLPARARELRRQGLSTRQIANRLGVPFNGSVKRWVLGVQPPGWTRRPRAKDGLRLRAVAMRGEGRTYDDIAAELGVSKSTCSLWLRDLPRPAREPAAPRDDRRAARAAEEPIVPVELSRLARELGQPEGSSSTARRAGPVVRTREAARRERQIRRLNDKLAAARLLGAPDVRDVVVAAVTAYWCEGAKDKPYERREHLYFVNSDPRLVQLWLRFLELAGVAPDRLRLRVQIHESADVEAATRFWSEVTGVPVGRFQRPSLKRHAARTNRRNTGAAYVGCLCIGVLRSARLYRVVEGAFTAITSGCVA